MFTLNHLIKLLTLNTKANTFGELNPMIHVKLYQKLYHQNDLYFFTETLQM